MATKAFDGKPDKGSYPSRHSDAATSPTTNYFGSGTEDLRKSYHGTVVL
uniref:Uncharacterized protein n=1 Tax=Setaria digitata TaxID=48799 RepID=A0A915PH25_9BILA